MARHREWNNELPGVLLLFHRLDPGLRGAPDFGCDLAAFE
jgi:hypothetical protein